MRPCSPYLFHFRQLLRQCCLLGHLRLSHQPFPPTPEIIAAHAILSIRHKSRQHLRQEFRQSPGKKIGNSGKNGKAFSCPATLLPVSTLNSSAFAPNCGPGNNPGNDFGNAAAFCIAFSICSS